jgi:hypothetical protein
VRRLAAAWLVATLLVVGLGQVAAAQSGAPDPPVLRDIETQVMQIRGLTALSEPPLGVVDSAGMARLLSDEFDRDYLPADRESDQKLYVALGLLKSSENLVQIQLNLLASQVVGVYDPDTKSMIVLGDHQFGAPEKVTYAHEFNHALQDQYFDLNGLAPKHPVSNDRSFAVHALVEGDAVLLQTLWGAANLSSQETGELARSGGGEGAAALARAPLVIRTELIFPYLEGFNFVRQAYRQAGNSYAGIDELFRNPPTSTAQILHYDKYRAGWQPTDVPLPDVAGTLGPDWRTVGTGVLGELDTRIVLEQWGTDRLDAARVAAGWAGDRWQLVEKDGRTALAMRSTWDSPTAARAFFSAYTRGLRQRYDAAVTLESSSTRQALTTPVAATDVRLDGADVVTVLAFDRDSADALIGVLTPPAP